MDEARRHGCMLSHVDCDGNIHDLVASWVRVGVNIMFPCEVAAGTVTVRTRDNVVHGPAAVDELIARLQGEVRTRARA
jgi:hypothetical protein